MPRALLNWIQKELATAADLIAVDGDRLREGAPIRGGDQRRRLLSMPGRHLKADIAVMLGDVR